jgi:RNA polymerase sigma-70 factor (ECF subfamily)
MRAIWQDLHTNLLRSTESLAAKKQLDVAKRERPEIRRFADLTSLLDYLHAKNDDVGAKDRILAAFVDIAQTGCDDAEFAMTILWLAFWPGLDALYRRLWRHFSEEPEDLVSAIAGWFTVAVRRADMTRIRRVAATLLRNVERNIRYEHRQAREERARLVEIVEEESPKGHDTNPGGDAPEHSFVSLLGLPRGMDADQETVLIHDRLARLVNGHAALVVAVVIFGEHQCDVAHRLGISEDAVRKRFQRALACLREEFDFVRVSMSRSEPQSRVF